MKDLRQPVAGWVAQELAEAKRAIVKRCLQRTFANIEYKGDSELHEVGGWERLAEET